ncbi:hypothetical protein OEZ86_012500 [Tetradesmus obliquus]|nr:hypothetical protein OEZ86_012500 [Tetradesmus obliquus]
MKQINFVKASAAPARCPYAFRSRTQCVRPRAAACKQPSSQQQSSSSSSGPVSRRDLLAGPAAASVLLLISQAAGPAAADELAAEEAVAAAAAAPAPAAAAEEVAAAAPEAEAAATPPAPAAAAAPATTITEKITNEGAIRLATSEQATRNMTPTDKQVFALNGRVQAQNRAPIDFPAFIRQGFDITVVGDGYVMDADGLIFKDFVIGSGTLPEEGQQVVFDYTAYNESGAVIDSSYRKGRAAETRLGIQGLIPGFEMGIRSMRPGGKRRIVVPPALGPPVGPSTFFSAKQCEVFDVELRQVRKCERRQMMMFSDVVCE